MFSGVLRRTYQPGLHLGMQTSMESAVVGVKVIVTESVAAAGLVIATVYATDGTAEATGLTSAAMQRNAISVRARI
jgi:hypothetical protein